MVFTDVSDLRAISVLKLTVCTMKLEINRLNLQFCFNNEVWCLQSRGSQDHVFVGKTVLWQQLKYKQSENLCD